MRVAMSAFLVLFSTAAVAHGNEPLQESAAGAEAARESAVELNLPPNVELRVLVEYVAQRLGMNILYDEQLANKRITLRAAERVPVESLRGVLESALQTKGLLLVRDDQPGWWRIVPANNLQAVARPEEAGAPADRPTEVVVEVFVPEHTDPRKLEPLVRPFLTQPGGNLMVLPEQRRLIVTDLASNVDRIRRLVAMADQPAGRVLTEFVPVQHLEAAAAAQQVIQLMTSHMRVRSGEANLTQELDVGSDARTNQVILTGRPERVAEAGTVLEALDVPLGLITHIYSFDVVSPERVDRLAQGLIDPVRAKQLYRSSIDRDARMLVVSTTPEIHEQIRSLQKSLDRPLAESQNPVRFYKLLNTSAVEVLATIRELEGERGIASISAALEAGHTSSTEEPTAAPPAQPSGANRPPAEPGEAPPLPPFVEEDAPAGSLATVPTARAGAVRSERATVVADVNTNTLIVVADPEVQQIYESLIRRLDKRRPQVLIEATIVTVDTSDNFSFGVDIAAREDVSIGGSPAETIVFSNFGLGKINPDTGRLSLTPGLGFNGAVLSGDIADVVIRALRADSRARVMSVPKVLVNDNATGTINSVSEQPFVSVNASDTVATTSFGGFVEAGTEITVTPHIAEGDHLLLEFEVALRSFTGDAGEGIPPPRQTNSVSSQVTVPDGYTVVVGGINRNNASEAVQRVPILGELPIIEYFFSSRDLSNSSSTLFVFIKPVILRDDQFRDLKFISRRDSREAELTNDGQAPASLPMLVR